MTRANRLRVEEGLFYLTHRCHNRSFLLKFAKDRNAYEELNMVRCGAVNHPSQWDWVGYYEIMGRRRRYRLLDMDRLLWRLNDPCLEKMRNHLEVGIFEALAKIDRKRQTAWTEGLVVGSHGFMEAARGWISSR